MKTFIRTVIALATLTTSAFLFAGNVQEINRTESMSLMAFRTVSVSHTYTADPVLRELAQKAELAGASSYRITSISGNNLLYGTAVLYR
ncbi:TPA: DUF1471 domain-containing protein [Enterobacter hormaechei subsp. steigerwaltii]|nr:DUF1471 domain-containing protein [Enterobacter hormaechei subsp. steigerwaltii]